MKDKMKWAKPALTKLGQARVSSGAECVGGASNFYACGSGSSVAELACSSGYSPKPFCSQGNSAYNS